MNGRIIVFHRDRHTLKFHRLALTVQPMPFLLEGGGPMPLLGTLSKHRHPEKRTCGTHGVPLESAITYHFRISLPPIFHISEPQRRRLHPPCVLPPSARSLGPDAIPRILRWHTLELKGCLVMVLSQDTYTALHFRI